MANVSLWGHSQFRRLFASTTSFTLGIQIYQLGMPLILYELTRSAAAMTAMRAVELLPNLPLALVGSSFGSVTGNVWVWGYRQESTDSQYIGRVSGLTGSIFKLLSACAAAHVLTVLGTRLSAVYRIPWVHF